MKITRKELLKRAAGAGFVLLGGSALMEYVFGRDREGARVRWGMIVDVKRCMEAGDCTRCIGACHGAHNVPSIPDPLREVKWLWKEEMGALFPELAGGIANAELTREKAMAFCNHCTSAPCVRVCPTGATFHRDDGIVMMDQHRCIGCRYCMAACPYGSRSFNWHDPRKFLPAGSLNKNYPTRTKGVVEKCDFCAERIDESGMPACVEACTARALAFGNLADPHSSMRSLFRNRVALRRRAELDTDPGVYYLL